MPRPCLAFAPRRDFPGRRWLIVALRSAHLVALMPVAAAVLAGQAATHAAGLALLLTGLALWGIELWANPKHRGELAGLFIPVKLAAVAWMIAQPATALPVFWALVIGSSVVSHAPAAFRHWRPLGPALPLGEPGDQSRASNVSKPG
jgi:hypothetical protein